MSCQKLRAALRRAKGPTLNTPEAAGILLIRYRRTIKCPIFVLAVSGKRARIES